MGTITTGNNEMARNCQVAGVIQGNLTLPKRPDTENTVYSLSGAVEVGVDGGATGILTIEPGVTVFGSSGGDFLLVNRGSQLFAEGLPLQHRSSLPPVRTYLKEPQPLTVSASGAVSLYLGRAPISDCATGGASNPGWYAGPIVKLSLRVHPTRFMEEPFQQTPVVGCPLSRYAIPVLRFLPATS